MWEASQGLILILIAMFLIGILSMPGAGKSRSRAGQRPEIKGQAKDAPSIGAIAVANRPQGLRAAVGSVKAVVSPEANKPASKAIEHAAEGNA
jgi:hypothetical protein